MYFLSGAHGHGLSVGRADTFVNAAVDMQRAAKIYNVGKPQEEQILQCIGLGYGPKLRIGDQEVFGREVNAASKLGEDIAKAWEILVTDSLQAAASTVPGLQIRTHRRNPTWRSKRSAGDLHAIKRVHFLKYCP